jgi:hypothetical protein
MKKIIICFAMMFMVIGLEFSFSQSNFAENWLYIGPKIGGSLHLTDPSKDYFDESGISAYYGSFDAGLQISFQLKDFFAIQTEALYSQTNTKFCTRHYIIPSDNPLSLDYYRYFEETQSFKMHTLTIPLLAKFTARLEYLYFAGYTGFYFPIPLGKMDIITDLTFPYGDPESNSESYNFRTFPGFIVGGSVGIKGGPGTFFLDIRYGVDFADTEIQVEQKYFPIFKRSTLHFSVGYEFGLIYK